MSEEHFSATRDAEVSQLGMQALWRLAIWGGLATFALFAAVMATYSHAGSQRQTASITSGQTTKQPLAVIRESAPLPSEAAEETRRLAEAVHALAADRDQLLTRIAAVERNLDGVTGSIKRDRIIGQQQAQTQIPPQLPPQVPTPAPTQTLAQSPPQLPPQAPIQVPTPTLVQIPPQAAPENPPPAVAPAPLARPETPPTPATEAAVSATQPPAVQQSGPGDAAPTGAPDAGNRPAAAPSNLASVTAPAPAASGLGVDIGGATNYEALRALWRATKNNDPTLLEELYPVVTIRENGKTHGADLRLVIGPIVDAEAASRLCMILASGHHYCQPVAFEGQHLSLADAPLKAPPRHSDASRSQASEWEPGLKVAPGSNFFPHGK
jgi:outer membrane biosynthesis protein TonB